MKWIRTCQECGSEQVDKEPVVQGVTTNAYANRACKRCGSEALDYGSSVPSTSEEIEAANQFMESYIAGE